LPSAEAEAEAEDWMSLNSFDIFHPFGVRPFGAICVLHFPPQCTYAYCKGDAIWIHFI
jgi:hypothetical protein